LRSDINSFKDLLTILPANTVKLLEQTYKSVHDIDLYIGATLETFSSSSRQVLGPTFSCFFRDHYRRVISGDAYFFSHSSNPNPFTAAQMKAIKDVSINHLICTTFTVEFTNQNPLLIPSSTNLKVPCSTFRSMDLTPWKV
jgi:hypothetical protein